jgi:hypothetical protein
MFVEDLAVLPAQAEYYRDGACDLVRKIVPSDIMDSSHDLAARIRFNDLLPMIQISDLLQAPSRLSLLLLCKYRMNAAQFFYELVSRWLIPHKRLNIEIFFSSDVRLAHLSDDLLTVCEIVVEIRSAQDLEEIRRNIKQIETEIRLGAVSNYQAQRILEFKGLSNDGKTAMIQDKIRSLIQNCSKDFDSGIFSQMQHFLVTCREEFKKERDYRHISRIISNLYSLQKRLRQNIDIDSLRRHVIVRLLKTKLSSHGEPGKRSVLGILAGLNFLREHEIFEKKHFIEAVSQQIENVCFVDGSFFIDRAPEGSVQITYMEIEKDDRSEFSLKEIRILRSGLPEYMKGHIEQLAHPVFMPRNEEEVLRNIMILSRQLRFVTDIPQVIISFDEQKNGEICFTVILVRSTAGETRAVTQILEAAEAKMSILPDRVRSLGVLGRKHIREATVFRACVEEKQFLRLDHSLDLYQARQYVLSELSRALGPVRDYNGGMIGKQNEVLAAFKKKLGRCAQQNVLLLEKFFFSLTPVELRSIMEPEHLKQLFLLLLQAKKTKQHARKKCGGCLFQQEEKRIYIVLPDCEWRVRETVCRSLEELGLPPYQLISFAFDFMDRPYVGFIFQCDNLLDQKQFYDVVDRVRSC